MSLELTWLADGKLAQLAQPVELDGRLSSHPLDARGFASFNCYWLGEAGSALLIDTGFTAHEGAVLAALQSLLEPNTALAVWAQRVGEYPSISNVVAIAERFGFDTFYSQQDRGTEWVDFRPDHDPIARSELAGVADRVAGTGGEVVLGAAGRRLDVLDAPLCLLPTNWIRDATTRTLFTADAFAYTWADTAAGPWVLDDADPVPDVETVLDRLLTSRFWWLAGARTDPLRRRIAEIFSDDEIEIIAPAFGAVIRGRETVRRHVAVLDDVLRLAAERPSIGLATTASP